MAHKSHRILSDRHCLQVWKLASTAAGSPGTEPGAGKQNQDCSEPELALARTHLDHNGFGPELPRKEAIASIRWRISADGNSSFFCRETNASCCGRIQLLPATEGSNCFVPQEEAIASPRRRKHFLPSTRGSDRFRPQKETVASFRRKNHSFLPWT